MKSLLPVMIVGSILQFLGCASGPVRKVQPILQPERFPMAWTQMGPQSTALVRALVNDTGCPILTLESGTGTLRVPMKVRSEPSAEFPLRVCEAAVPTGTRKAELAGKAIRLPRPQPKKILILGDTGCRMKSSPEYSEFQDCNDSKAWPFAKVADAGSRFKPDLVVHVGDYHYRESPCPSNVPGCAGSPSGYGWDTWDADFFTPAKNLLHAAPWVFVRGNHEDCSRAWEGWFKILDSYPYSNQCIQTTDPYPVDLGPLKGFVLDSANADDRKGSSAAVEIYRNQLQQMKKSFPQSEWLWTHRPFWAIVKNYDPSKPPVPLNATLQSAAQDNLSPSLNWVVAGHVHNFQSFTFKGGAPSQLVAGMGGTLLEEPAKNLKGVSVGQRVIQSHLSLSRFGFLLLERQGPSKWKMDLYGAEGDLLQRCHLKKSTISCKPAK